MLRNAFWWPLLLVCGAAQAHVVFDDRDAQPHARAGSYYRAALVVSHGCDGSATRRLTVQIPDGVIAVKPMPKPGWKLDIRQGDYARSYTLHGKSIARGVRQLSWTGQLDDAYSDEFVFRAYLDASLPAGALAFPVVQDCVKGSTAWTEPPQDDAPAPHPAPLLQIAPPADPHAGHQH